MITEPLKRGTKCYWKTGDIYSLAYFLSLNKMPTAPHAVTVRHNGQEAIVRDFEVFTELDKFKDKHGEILSRLLARLNKMAQIARDLKVPYSRVLTVNKQAKEMGLIHEEE